MEIFTKIIEFFKKVWKYIAFAFTLIFITKIGGLLTKMRSSNKKEIKEVKKEIKKEVKQAEAKMEEVKEQEQELIQSLEKKDERVEQIIKDNTDRKEDLKTFLPDL